MLISQNQDEQKDGGVWGEIREEFRAGLEEARRELKEITLMLEQSQTDVNKLAQKNGAISAHLQQVQSQFDSLPRADIRAAYDATLDTQQRLFVMRGQLEKLQSDKAQIEKRIALMEKVYAAIEASSPQASSSRVVTSTSQTVEMMIQAQEAERQRLARKMHDEPAQALSNFILQTEIAVRLFDLDQAKAKQELATLKAAATSTFQKVRDFIFELRPMMLDDLGLDPTLKRYIEAIKEQSGVDVKLSVSGMEKRLESYIEVLIFRAVQEMVGNAIRHSQATQIKVQVDAPEPDVKVSVEDNGKGFDYENAVEKGMGLKLIRDRVQMLGGRFEVDSVVGHGTNIVFQIPAAKPKVFA